MDSDLISRKALLEKKREMELCWAVTERDILDAPAADRWIPVSERLPEDDLPKDSKVKQIKVFVAYKTNGRWVTRTQIRKKGYWYGAPDEWDWIKESDPITHWMPLPEPPGGNVL